MVETEEEKQKRLYRSLARSLDGKDNNEGTLDEETLSILHELTRESDRENAYWNASMNRVNELARQKRQEEYSFEKEQAEEEAIKSTTVKLNEQFNIDDRESEYREMARQLLNKFMKKENTNEEH